MDKKTTMLMILDGFGVNENSEGNAVKLAKIPNINEIMKQYPNTIIHTSGLDVGLPEGQMGNSEVGHTNIGAGRIVYQELTRITKSIEDGDFFSNQELVSAIENCKKNNSKLHVLGLLSDGGVHSHMRHLFAILELAKRKDFEDVYDAMDRDKRWERVKEAYDALVNGEGHRFASATAAIENSYQKEIFDEFVKPSVICKNDEPVATIGENDSVIFFNFRPDRAREITRTIVDPDFDGFERKYFKTYFVTFTNYDETLLPYVHIAFKKEEIKNTLGEYISKLGLTQLRIAETEKYAHVTFFFNGGEEKQYEGEDRILIPSPKVETYDMKPEMSAGEVTDKVVDAINSKKYDVIILNYANPDMVGHTGSLEATIKALEFLDGCVKRVVDAIENNDGTLLITADHGNAEQMIDYKTGELHTAHTTNPVPLVLIGREDVKLKEGRLADLAPTMLDLMNLAKPAEMTGESLIEK